MALAISTMSCRNCSGFLGRPRLLGFTPDLAFGQPSCENARMNNRDDPLDGRSEPNAELEQFGSFCRGHFNSLGQLAAKNPVLRFEVLDHLNEFFFGGSGNEQQKGMQNLFMWVECASR